jgi:diguanylate cyclase (GGDEF)-like protein
MTLQSGWRAPRIWFAALVLIALVPTAALAVHTAWEQYRLASARLEGEIGRTTRLAAEAHRRLLDGARQILAVMAELPEVQRVDPVVCGVRFAELLRRAPQYVNLGLVGADGVLACSAVPSSGGLSLADRRFVRRALDVRDVTPAEFQLDPVTGTPTVVLGYPVVGPGGQASGVVFAALDPAAFTQIAGEIRFADQVTLTVVDASGTIVARHPEPRRWVGIAMPTEPVIRAVLGQGEGALDGPGPDGVRRLQVFVPVGHPSRSGLYVILGIARGAALTEAGRLLAVGIGGTALVLGLVLGGAWVALRRFDTLMRTMEGDQRAKDVLMDQVTALVSRRANEVALLNQLGGHLQACLSLEEASAIVGRLGPQLFPGAAGALFIVDAPRHAVERVAVWGHPGVSGPPLFPPDGCWALRRGQLFLVSDTAAGLVCPHVGPPVPPAYLCVPLLAQNEALGVLHLAVPAPLAARPGEPGEAPERLAVAVAEQLALALANLRLREELRAQSIRDPLTGLFNRRYMEETFERELRRAEREHLPVTLLLVDVDHFKRFNDAFGHDGGDAVLAALGALLRERVRAGDIACRHGGEEFLLILPGASIEGGRRRGNELREAVRELQVFHRGALLSPITVSIGIAAFPDHGPTGEALIRAADAALYRAKHEGRDQVALAG